MDRNENIESGVFLETGRGENKLVEVWKTDFPLTNIVKRSPKWKQYLEQMLLNRSWELVTVNVLAKRDERGFNSVVTVKSERQELGRKKPVTRGGRPVGKPTMERTMRTRKPSAFRDAIKGKS